MKKDPEPKSQSSENVKVSFAIQKSIEVDTYVPTKAGFAIRPIVSLTNVLSVASNQNIAPFVKQTMCCVF